MNFCYDYEELLKTFEKLIDEGDNKQLGIRYYMFLYEAKEIDKATNAHNLLYKRIKM